MGWVGIGPCILFQRFWKGIPPADMMGIDTEPCLGFHLPWKGLPPSDIPCNGNDPCQGFQSPCEDKTQVIPPCVVIVPCTGLFCPKPRLPPTEMIAEEKSLLPNLSNKENDMDPTSVV
jgi:hypothetical protein